MPSSGVTVSVHTVTVRVIVTFVWTYYYMAALQSNVIKGTDTGSGVRQSDNTLDRAGPEGRGGWRCD